MSKPSSRVCQSCGGTEIDEDPARGDAVCVGCGAVLEENVIVSEVQFQETNSGSQAAVGHFVAEGSSIRIGVGNLQGFTGKESREVTVQNARRRIQEVASQLRLNQHCIDVALNFYKMALSRGLTRGRPSSHVIAGCLYITCRTEGTSHLLLDFSDVLEVNVYDLGKAYSYLAKSLYISLPPTDPCVYVLRFAHSLKFGDKEHEVSNLALRLVQRMKRDWIAIGRRPTGLCGAALLIAARYYNFNRTLDDIVNVVCMSRHSIKKRLFEFSQTASSALSLDEFTSVDIEQEADPPAFTEGRRKARRVVFDSEKLEAMKEPLLEMEKNVEMAVELKNRRRFGGTQSTKATEMIAAADGTQELLGEAGCSSEEVLACEEFLEGEILSDSLGPDFSSQSSASLAHSQVHTGNNLTPAQRLSSLKPTLQSLGLTSTATSGPKKEVQGSLTETPGSSRSLPEGRKVEEENGSFEFNEEEELDLDSYLLSPEEVRIKSTIWHSANGTFMEQMEEKRKRREEEERVKAEQHPKKKRKRQAKKPSQPAGSAGEAIQKIVQERKLSAKINYEVLNNLTGGLSDLENDKS